MSTPNEILTFWFGSAQLNAMPGDELRRRWFAVDETFDQTIADRFQNTVEAAVNGELSQWRQTLEGEMALVLVCDQFTRNIYRGTERAFAGDPQALETARGVIERSDDQTMGLYQRAFLGLPLEHSEDPEMQHHSVAYFHRLHADYLDDAETAVQSERFHQYALAHRQVIEDFGRFPHRNKALGRASTAAEQRWLEQGGGF
ncbi:DUF924 family protein [Microbulbifer thermotolerans]|uniref:DUF924 family protein n=1 Tax=Microbulbifer thermotolerans TaxID=252514 RepID=UPI00224B64B7|nr:DUF924 family protein [Microbulbifer thermotolerans]MCX2779975.1 DUF924 domain-containing protein [Microbulbifer thermotolerans]MCX2805398.1 DUF924 domain-containing protein [Microbulbifer thermotolerans]